MPLIIFLIILFTSSSAHAQFDHKPPSREDNPFITGSPEIKACLKKAGKAFSKAEIDSITAQIEIHTTDGVSLKNAEILALESFVRDTHQNVTDYEKEIAASSAGEFLTGAMFGLAVLARSGFPRETLDKFVDNTMASLTG